MTEMDHRTSQGVALFVADVLQRMLRGVVAPDAGQVFSVWLRPNRIVISVDPLALRNMDRVLSGRFVHQLSTALGGRKVVTTNSRGVFLQIGYWPQPSTELRSVPLDLDRQPGPLCVPIGTTAKGPLWLPIIELDSVLIGGSRGMGKSTLVHAWIQALIYGGQARLFLWDGKDGAEFNRYASEPGVATDADLHQVLSQLQAEADRRRQELTASGYSSVAEYNERNPLKIPPLVLFVDEAAFIPEDCQQIVADLVARGRSSGVYPVLATQRPGVAQVQALVKTNLSTRIAFSVPQGIDSRVILDRMGAEKLPHVAGRLCFVWKARLIKAQAFSIEKPQLPESTAPAGPELDLARRALRESEGKMSIPLLILWGMQERQARVLVEEWERRGWLQKDPARNNARVITPTLEAILSNGQTGQAPSNGVQALGDTVQTRVNRLSN